MSREIDRYTTTIHVFTAIWDSIETGDLPCNLNNIEGNIWFPEGKPVEPDLLIYEEGEEFVFGELKGTVSDLELETCMRDLEKYTSDFHPNKDDVENPKIQPRSPRSVFFITHTDHIKKIISKFKRNHQNFSINEVPVCFLSYQIYQGAGGKDRLRIEHNAGDCGDSVFLENVVTEGLKQPSNGNSYSISTLTMYGHSKDLHYCSSKPPDPYTANRLVQHLGQYRSSDTIRSSEKTEVGLDEVVETFKESNSSSYTEPRSSWIKDGLEVLETYGWIYIENGSIEIHWGEFQKNREKDDLHQFFAKESCKEKAIADYDEDDEEEEKFLELDESQRRLSDFNEPS